MIGERWTCLILRASMFGLRHFEEFQACLGIARNILSDRLAHLVENEILARSPDPDDRRKVIYALTERGAALLPVMAALRQWALDGGYGDPSYPHLADRRDRKPVARMELQSHDGRPLKLQDLAWVGPDGEELFLPRTLRRSQSAAA
ncbi:helix-turn-helix domain-containing protein [Sphingomonas rosea]|uniref:Helix-turn-helix domain-containing protein n=1 Tax=Sphingomonas rosea TaxID=335605 RepID=A0ABP7TW41_9SPHN